MQRQLIDPIYTQIAGLIIVAPYLIKLFSELNFTQENQFVDPVSQQRAVQLLGYVAFGNPDVEESYLSFAKVLCGMSITHPITLDTPLKKAELEVADSMLVAILKNWPALASGTTIMGLRETFLQRDGRLEENETVFHLKVERKTLDILLDQIPWNFRLIMLSWMQKVIQVEW